MEYENLEIGNELPKLEAKKVTIVEYEERPVEDEKTKKSFGTKLVLKVKHPDCDALEISKIKYEKNKKLKEAGSWLTKDPDGKLPFNSAVSIFLRHYKYNTIKELIGKEIDTTTDESGFLVIKAY